MQALFTRFVITSSIQNISRCDDRSRRLAQDKTRVLLVCFDSHCPFALILFLFSAAILSIVALVADICYLGLISGLTYPALTPLPHDLSDVSPNLAAYTLASAISHPADHRHFSHPRGSHSRLTLGR
jgi:hypothetical protein